MDTTPDPPLPRDQAPSTSCPHCALHTARAVSVITSKTEEGVVEITMQCTQCNATWMQRKITHEEAPQ